MANVSQITDSTFEQEVLKSSVPTLVDFWATWCGPCRAIAPKLEEIAQSLGSQVKIVKLDVDQNPSTPAQFNVRGIPTLILFKNGKMLDQIVGNQPKEVIEDLLKRAIG